MGMLSGLWILGLVALAPGKAFLDLNGTWEVQGTWRASVTLPCSYEPLPDFNEVSVVWKTSQQDHGLRTIFHRDAASGDQTLLASFKGRLSVPKEPPGVLSLQIKALEMADAGQYICEVTWQTRNKNRLTRDWTTTLRVVKVPVTKPVIQLSSNGSVLSPGMKLTLTCLASGSPPLTYRWLKIVSEGAATQVGADAVLQFERLELSDTGRYYCEAKSQVGAPSVQWSKTVQLSVQETVAATDRDVSGSQAPRKASLPLYLVILIALLCAVLVIAVFAVTFFRRRAKEDHTYQVAYHNNSMSVRDEGSPASPGCTSVCECPYEEPSSRTQNNYTEEPTRGGGYMAMGGTEKPGDTGYESLVNKESEYELLNDS